MYPIKAILVDDEPRARRVLKKLIENHSFNISIVGECSHIPEAVKLIKKESPDVVFLDVEMPNYAGYEIVNFFDTIDFEIIFVTAFDDYAVKAFEVCAMDYLVKPIDRIRLIETIERLKEKLDKKDRLIHYKTLLKTITDSKIEKIIIPEIGDRKIINISEIIAFEADGAYTKIHLLNQNVLLVSKNLKYFEKIVTDLPQFLRSHRAWIINLNYAKTINKSGYMLNLEGNIAAKISRTALARLNDVIR